MTSAPGSIHTHTHTHTYTHTHTHTWVYIYIYTGVNIYGCIYTFRVIHIYIHLCIWVSNGYSSSHTWLKRDLV
jgi:hypothetical protein